MIIPRTNHGLAHAVFKNLGVMTAVFSAVVGACILYLLTATPIYQATASLAIDFSKDAKLEIHTDEGAEVVLPEIRRATVANYERLLMSRDLLSEIIEEIGIERLFPDFDAPAIAEAQAATDGDQALERLQMLIQGGGVGADAEAGAEAGAVGAAGSTVQLTPRERLLSKAVRLFRADFMIDSSQDNTVLELSFFHEDPDLATYTLSRIIDKFIVKRAEIFQNPHLPFLSAQLEQSLQDLTLAKEQLFQFRRESGIFLAERQLQRMVDQRETIQSEIDSLTYELSGLLERGDARGQNRLVASRGAAEARVEFLKRQISSVDDRIAIHVAAAHELARFEQEVESKEETYEQILTRLERARFAERVNAGSISPVSVLDQPKTGDKPARPRKTLLLLGAMALGGLAALAAGLGREIMQTRFSTPEQVIAELDLPALAVIRADAPNLLATLHGKSDPRRRARRQEAAKAARARGKPRRPAKTDAAAAQAAKAGKPKDEATQTQAATTQDATAQDASGQSPIDPLEMGAAPVETAATAAGRQAKLRLVEERAPDERTVDVSGAPAADPRSRDPRADQNAPHETRDGGPRTQETSA